MSLLRTRAFLLALPRVAETVQWGDNFVYWVADKHVGGKMFALMPSEPGRHVLSFAAPVDRYNELLEVDGVVPAPYFARIGWVALEHWQALRGSELDALLQAGYDRTEAKLPRRVQRALELPDRAYRALVRESKAAAKEKK